MSLSLDGVAGLDGVGGVGDDAGGGEQDGNGRIEAFELLLAAGDEGDAFDLRGDVDDAGGDEHLTGAGQAAQPRRAVERRAAIAAVYGDGLADVQADADAGGQLG